MALDLEGFNGIANVEEPDEGVVDRLRMDDSLDIPWQLTDIDLWNNYCDNELYEMDKQVRLFLKKHRWTKEKKGKLRTSASLVFAWIFGRMPTNHDSQVCVTLNRLLKYYCTSYTGQSQIGGRKVSRVYVFSKYSCRNKRPMSLRLRLEERNDEYAFRSYGEGRDKRRHAGRGHRQDGEPSDGQGGEAQRGEDA